VGRAAGRHRRRTRAEEGTPFPERTLASIKRNRVGIKGPTTTPVGSGFRSVNVLLRKELDLYACIRPCKAYEGVRTSYPETDIVIVRENTEDLYAGIEFEREREDNAKLRELPGRAWARRFARTPASRSSRSHGSARTASSRRPSSTPRTTTATR
jgi:isocitrate dehydrogenase